MSIRLSLCIPTHQGRREVLGELLEAVEVELRERPPDCEVEVCVSDNASEDGTRELVAAASERIGCPLRYRRNDRDLGLVPNFIAVLEQASGDYCWLLGSDDLPAPGALRTVSEAIARLPGMGGYVFPSVDVNASDSRLRTVQPPRALLPLSTTETVYEGADAIFDGVGNAWIGISWNVIAREPAMRQLRVNRARMLANPTWPQIVLLAAVAAECGRWAWCPETIALWRRSADPFLFERSSISLADRWAELVRGLADAWAEVLGGRGGAWRRRMRIVHLAWGKAPDVRATKLYGRPTAAAQLHLLATVLKTFGHAPGFARELLPALLLPDSVVRRLHDPAHGRNGRRAVPVTGRDVVEIEGGLPANVVAGGVAHVSVRIVNDAHYTLPATGPRAAGIVQRWMTTTPGAPPLDAAALGLDELGAQPTPLEAPIRRGSSRGQWIALLPPREPGSYTLELVPSQAGIGTLDGVGAAKPLVAQVEVR